VPCLLSAYPSHSVSESPYTLRRGDAVSLAAGTPQQWENTDSHAARVLIVAARVGS
jgi:quercetin dioxygenase-like cupin family protein